MRSMIRHDKHSCVSTMFMQMMVLAINRVPGQGVEGKISRRTINSPMKLLMQQTLVEGQLRGDALLCTQHTWFLIKWNCIRTRRAFKRRPNHISSPAPLSLGQEWRNSCNFRIHWMQLADLSVYGASFVDDVCRLPECLHTLSLCWSYGDPYIIVFLECFKSNSMFLECFKSNSMYHVGWHLMCDFKQPLIPKLV